MYKCPQCGDLFEKVKEIKDHLASDTPGKVMIVGKLKDGNRCPLWPPDQIEYYAAKGLLEE